MAVRRQYASPTCSSTQTERIVTARAQAIALIALLRISWTDHSGIGALGHTFTALPHSYQKTMPEFWYFTTQFAVAVQNSAPKKLHAEVPLPEFRRIISHAFN